MPTSSDSSDEEYSSLFSDLKNDKKVEPEENEESVSEEFRTGSENESKSDKSEENKEKVKQEGDSKKGIRKRRKRKINWDRFDESLISKPNTEREKELMSKVFGGKDDLISTLLNEKNVDNNTTNTERAAAWQDSDEEDEIVKAETITTKKRRRKFEKIVGNPKWADLDKKKEVDSDDEILKTVGHVVKRTNASLSKGLLEIKRLKELNRSTRNEGVITTVIFHPTSTVAVITGAAGFCSIVAVDGEKNEKLHTLGLKLFKKTTCQISPDGSELIFGGERQFMHVYNMLTGKSDKVLFRKEIMRKMEQFVISPCGKFIAVVADCGEINILDGITKEHLTSLQQRYDCSSICFTPDSKYLFCHSNDVEITVYEVQKARIVHIFVDEGCVNGSCITVSPNGQYLATGNRQGVVNIYSLDKVMATKYPTAEKAILNLTTTISSLTFNPTSEILAIASKKAHNAVKLLHVPSGTIFSNFPAQHVFGKAIAVAFSPGSGFLAIGNSKSSVSLFRLKHYQNY